VTNCHHYKGSFATQLYKLQDTLAMQRGNYLSWQAFAKGHDLPRKHSEEVFGRWLQLCSTPHDPNSKKMHENVSPFAIGLQYITNRKNHLPCSIATIGLGKRLPRGMILPRKNSEENFGKWLQFCLAQHTARPELEEKCDKLPPFATHLYKSQISLAMQRGNYQS
jgi:hypothetical protein